MAKEWKAVGSVGTIGLEVVLSILLGFFAGRWLDGRFHTAPYLAIVGFLFGTAAAVKSILRAWKQMQAEAVREEREQGNPAPLFDKYTDPPDSKRDDQDDPLAPEDGAPEHTDSDPPHKRGRGREDDGE